MPAGSQTQSAKRIVCRKRLRYVVPTLWDGGPAEVAFDPGNYYSLSMDGVNSFVLLSLSCLVNHASFWLSFDGLRFA